MTPAFTANYVAYGVLAYCKSVGNFADVIATHVHFANFTDKLLGKLGMRVRLAFARLITTAVVNVVRWRAVLAALHHVARILFLRAPVEVCTVAAFEVIAVMQRVWFIFRCGTVSEKARYSRGNDVSAAILAGRHFKCAIAFARDGSGVPFPALIQIAAMDFGPKSANIFIGQCKHRVTIAPKSA